ncbi:DgyrCDS7689 [Dimorphilus gyrociliatus]|uniref:DgyrCDS7689 n=1 Tax=Dimorphilus gyrociliatus TaxID=2664684 RepID=A0A7I8VRZ4_9ANNE|nr:DgyrCDS7689 [Dimorphilus gyrociliatus]
MSEVLERTISSLNSVLFGTSTTETSKFHQNFVSSLQRAQSPYEESDIITAEIEKQKELLIRTDTSELDLQFNFLQHTIREVISRACICFLYGFNVDHAILPAINMVGKPSLLSKRIGYTVCGILMNSKSRHINMLVNTVQKDLKSTNMAENHYALIAVTQLIPTDIMPLFVPILLDKLSHPSPGLRRKAVYAFHHILKIDQELVSHLNHKFISLLGDKDPQVVGAAIQLLISVAKQNSTGLKDIIPAITFFVEQILNGKLSKEFHYCTMIAPWFLLDTVSLFSIVLENIPEASTAIYPVITIIIQRINMSENIGLAILYECVICVLKMKEQPFLIDHIKKCTAKLLSSQFPNNLLTGLNILLKLTEIDSKSCIEHQNLLFNCLTIQDNSIRSKAFEILFLITNISNATAVCYQILKRITDSSSNDKHEQEKLAKYLYEIIERYFQVSQQWMNIFVKICKMKELTLSRSCGYRIETAFEALRSESFEPKGILVESVKTMWSILCDNESDGMSNNALFTLVLCVVSYRYDADIECESILLRMLNMFQSSKNNKNLRMFLVDLIITHLLHEFCKNKDDYFREMLQTIEPNEFLLRAKMNELDCCCSIEHDIAKFDYSNQDYTLSQLDDVVADSLQNGAKPYKKPSAKAMATSDGSRISTDSDLRSFNRDHSTDSDRNSSMYIGAGLWSSQKLEPTLDVRKTIWSSEGQLVSDEDTLIDYRFVPKTNVEDGETSSHILPNMDANHWSDNLVQTIFKDIDDGEKTEEEEEEIDTGATVSPIKKILSSEELHDSLEEPLHLPEALFKGVENTAD